MDKFLDLTIGNIVSWVLIAGSWVAMWQKTKDKVENVVNTESTGVGIRVIANGTWGFCATSDMSTAGVAAAARQAQQLVSAQGLVRMPDEYRQQGELA